MVVNAALLSKLLSNSPNVLGVPSRHAFERIYPGAAVTRRKAARCSHGASLRDRGHSPGWILFDNHLSSTDSGRSSESITSVSTSSRSQCAF